MQLTNPRHERFAQLVAGGADSTNAYRSIYPKAKGASAETAGPRLLGIVRERVSELQAASATETTLSIQEKREFYAAIVRTPICDITETHVLCQSVKRTNSESGSSIEYKAIDKLKASQLDSELAGHIVQAEKQAINVNVGVAVSVMTEERRAELMAKKQAAIARRLQLTHG